MVADRGPDAQVVQIASYNYTGDAFSGCHYVPVFRVASDPGAPDLSAIPALGFSLCYKA